MIGASASRASHGPHANRWVLAETRLQLLAIGDALYGGTSPRTVLDITARQLLLPRMRRVILDGTARTDTVVNGGRRVTIRVVPILGPVSGAPLAVLGCYGHDPAGCPPEPLVGAWEWRVTPPGPDQEMRAYWSESLYDVYALPRPTAPTTAGSPRNYWEGPEWLDRFIVDSDRAEMRYLLDKLITATTDALFIHSYRVHNPATRETHRLRLAGRSYAADGGPARWLRGVSMRIDHLGPDPYIAASSMSYLDAAFTVASEPLCAVDILYEHIYMTSQAFGNLGIELPPHRHLPRMVHPDDIDSLRRWLKDAASSPDTSAGPVRVRFRSAGGWKRLSFIGTGIRLPDGKTHCVLCRVTQADLNQADLNQADLNQ